MIGYGAAYLQFVDVKLTNLHQDVSGLRQQNELLQLKLVQSERQLQVEKAAQENLGEDLASLQDESMRLKEDVAFYRNILTERGGAPEVKIHTFKVNKGARANEYDYHILLMQAGSHDRIVQGDIRLTLNNASGSVPIAVPLGVENGGKPPAVSFKYYQQLDGKFVLPSAESDSFLELVFVEKGLNRPKISQRVSLPGTANNT